MKLFKLLSICAVLGFAAVACTHGGGEKAASEVKAEAKSEAKAAIGKKSLYDRLGGKPAIEAVTGEFIANVAADKRINSFFAKTNIPDLKRKLVDQICQASGGPCTYAGLNMKTAHSSDVLKKASAGKHDKVHEADFNALVEDLVKALDKFKVGKKEKQELLSALGGMKGDIVAK